MSELEKNGAKTDEKHRSFALLILNDEFQIKNGVALKPFNVFFAEHFEEIGDAVVGTSINVVSFSFLIEAIKQIIAELFEKKEMTMQVGRNVLKFFECSQTFFYFGPALVQMICFYNNERNASSDKQVKTLCYLLYMEAYHKLKESNFAIIVESFRLLVKSDEKLAKSMLSRLSVGPEYYDLVFDDLSQSNDALKIGYHLIYNGFVFDCKTAVKWIDENYGTNKLSLDLEIALLRIIHRFCDSWVALDERLYEDVLKDVVINRFNSVMTSIEVMHWLIQKYNKSGMNVDGLLKDLKVLRKRL